MQQQENRSEYIMPAKKENPPSIQLSTRTRFGVQFFLPAVLLLSMEFAILFTSAVMPLRALFFYVVLPGIRLSRWQFRLTNILFPGKAIIADHYRHINPASTLVAWKETLLLFACFAILFAIYAVAIRFLSRLVKLRFIFFSAAILGLTYVLYATSTSQDIFSYIAYARMGTLYHLNPLTAIPINIRHDPVFPYIYWTRQPSAYGPTWGIITCILQWFSIPFGTQSLLPMVLALRLFGLLMHLGSVLIVWSLSGSLLRGNDPTSQHRRIIATLAFAWNPLLLIEACINAHNDTTILFLILLALWFLRPHQREQAVPAYSYYTTAVFLAIAACLKITLMVVAPGLILFLWTQNPRNIRRIIGVTLTYILVMVSLYAPFWQSGSILRVFQVNPGLVGSVNSPYEFIVELFLSAVTVTGTQTPHYLIVSTERLTHQSSIALFILTYITLCLYSVVTPRRINSLPMLIRWMAFAWFLYCLVGSPWLWPWYLTTFFGLFAVVEATESYGRPLQAFLHMPLAVRLFAFATLTLYCFDTWGPHVTLVPGFPGNFHLIYLRGLWLCVIPLLAIRLIPQNPFRFLMWLSQQIKTTQPRKTIAM
jgi:hypothetical protein